MKLSVYVLAREVAVLESAGDFKSELTYLPNTAADDFVSLTMPVRTDPWVWEDQLPAIFQMNLPEGYKQIQKRSIREGVLTGDQLAISKDAALHGASTLTSPPAVAKAKSGVEGKLTTNLKRPVFPC